jgi:hypothetical protein
MTYWVMRSHVLAFAIERLNICFPRPAATTEKAVDKRSRPAQITGNPVLVWIGARGRLPSDRVASSVGEYTRAYAPPRHELSGKRLSVKSLD